MSDQVTTTMGPQQLDPQPLRRAAIIGTASSWQMTPWADKTLDKFGLNDLYALIGDLANTCAGWYDLHPFHEMHFRPRGQRVVAASQVPVGAYLRPEGHLDWLKSRPFPVYLQEHRPDWPNYRPFPMAELLKAWAPVWPLRLKRNGTVVAGEDYEVSTPSLMLMHLIASGYQEIHIYGIHLATEWEYVQQRPNMEFLMGVASGKGVKFILPETTPICRSSYRYAYQPKADLPVQAAQQEIALIKHVGLELRKQLLALPTSATDRRLDLEARLAQLDIDLMDARHVHAHRSAALVA